MTNKLTSKILEAYSRLTDTSLVPRYPLVLGKKATSREQVDTLRHRKPEKMQKHLQAISDFLKAMKSVNPNSVDSVRLKNINNDDLRQQRQIHRNRQGQHVRKIIEGMANSFKPHHWRMIPSADSVKLVKFVPGDPDDPKARRTITKHRAKRITLANKDQPDQ